MATWALTRVDPGEFAQHRDEIVALDARVRAAKGHEALGDAVWRDVAHPAADSAGFLLEGRGYVHVARGDRGDDASWTAALAVPDAAAATVTSVLLDAARVHAAARRGRVLTSWVFGAGAEDDAVFAEAGFRADRALHEMRVPLPLAVDAPVPDGFTFRAFEPGRDDDAVVRVNNAAFASHAEQGGWTVATLHAHMVDAWFDPTAFLLAFDRDGLAGFNWLKWHEPSGEEPARGEIYVIGVAPRTQGSGLGRALAIDGLRLMSERGAPVGTLFVAADNAGAIALYTSLGFAIHRTDRAYVTDLER